VGGCRFKVEAVFSTYKRNDSLETYSDQTYSREPSLILDIGSTTHRQPLRNTVAKIAQLNSSSVTSRDLPPSSNTTQYTMPYDDNT
jgi:hypothetical protein